MKTFTLRILTVRTILLCLLAATALPAPANGRGSARLDTWSEIFRWADLNRNNNLCSRERDRLKAAFPSRPDLAKLDLNRNGRLSSEEIDALEGDRRKFSDKDRKKGKKGKR